MKKADLIKLAAESVEPSQELVKKETRHILDNLVSSAKLGQGLPRSLLTNVRGMSPQKAHALARAVARELGETWGYDVFVHQDECNCVHLNIS